MAAAAVRLTQSSLFKLIINVWRLTLPPSHLSRYLQRGIISSSDGGGRCSGLGRPPKEGQHRFLPRTPGETSETADDFLVDYAADGVNMQGTLHILLLLHATRNDTKNVLNLLKTANGRSVKASFGTMSSILNIFVKNRNVDAAVEMHCIIQVDYPPHCLNWGSVIDLCTLLVGSERSQDAVKILEEYLQSKVKKDINISEIRDNCRNLLTTSAAKCDYGLTKRLFGILLSGGLAEPKNFIAVPLLQCRLNSGGEEYKTNEGLLERLFDLMSQRYGNVQAQHDLMFACLEAGLPNEARQVLQNLGKEVNVHEVNKMCKLYSRMELEEPLQHFLKASEGSKVVDRCNILAALLDVYNVQNAGEKGLSVWTMMQQEGLSPSKTFLSTLSLLLAANNLKIPF
ncbi:leucine-rich PPR motif-containing protein, mitochondrial isoform X2 [Cherax quadricarinatus]|uniref:leucine-rich PPR motif-containing protein, mitochondrial isoform X2 n=1 Tax=Cherax quadricarinatus TaxID=27406 RepID=UPI00387E52A8